MKKPIVRIALGIIVLFFAILVFRNPNEKVEYVWPNQGIATLLPKPDMQYGKIIFDSVDYFSIEIVDVSLDEFNDYIEDCKSKGFTENYSNSSYSYKAEDKNGNEIDVYYYESNEKMDIRIKAFEEETEKKTTETETTTLKEEVEKNTTSETTEQGQDVDFREWVDAYEGFMNEYVEFINKYNESDGTDLTLLTEYATFMSKYSEYMKAANNVKKDELTSDDYLYFIEAQNRIAKKLTEIQ